MSNLPPSQMPTLGGDEPQGSYRPPQQQPPPYYQQRPPQLNSPAPPAYQSPPSPRGNEVGRTARWVLLSVLAGFFIPICGLSLLCFATFAGFSYLIKDISNPDVTDGPTIGVIDLRGPIYSGTGAGASEEFMQEQIRWMDENSDIKAIVIRADSPGGDANASDIIWDELNQVEKPVVIYVEGMCASGCLYIASAGDEIMASRNSLVGSIGVISIFFNAEELLDNIGVEAKVIATGESKDFGSMFRDMTPEEETYWQRQIQDVLDNFIDVVANRPNSILTKAEVRELATGEVWSARIAQQNGLVDSIGYERDAIERAADLANISSYEVQEYPYDYFTWATFFANASQFKVDSAFDVPTTDDLMNSLQQPSLQYRYFGPYDNPAGRNN